MDVCFGDDHQLSLERSERQQRILLEAKERKDSQEPYYPLGKIGAILTRRSEFFF
jgi:hypothetical protein